MKIVRATIILFALLITSGFAQDNESLSDDLVRRPFYVDYAAFYDTASSTVRVEIYYKIFSSSLSYTKWDDKYKASYGVDITIMKKNKQVTGSSSDGNLVAQNYKDTMNRDDFVINTMTFTLQPDDYVLSARLTDGNSGDVLKEEQRLDLEKFHQNSPSLSTIEFVRETGEAVEKSQFTKGAIKVIPSVSRFFGYSEPEMYVYYEIYDSPGFKGEYLATYEIRDGNKVIMADTTLFPSGGSITQRTEKFELDELLPGKYELDVKIKSPGNKFELKSRANFGIEWSVLAIVKNDYKTAVDQLKYIASKAEIDSLLKAPPDQRIKYWNDFWKSKDPTPSTKENELMDEYYKRIRYSELNYGRSGRDGWKTDMGMIYITYGPPDEIERHPFDLDSKPYQIWYYYTQKKRFIFVDLNGYGDYELQYPFDGDLSKLR